jgi:hypothetical protein
MTVHGGLSPAARPLDCVMFDLDDTLYQCEEMREQVASNIRGERKHRPPLGQPCRQAPTFH